MRMYKQCFEYDRNERTITLLGKKYTVGAGNGDNIEVYTDKQSVYVYSENDSLEYVGFEVFDRETTEQQNEVFLQSGDSEDDITWLLNGSRTPSKIRFLLQWCE